MPSQLKRNYTRITFSLHQETADQMEELAIALNTPKATLIREALETFIDQNNGTSRIPLDQEIEFLDLLHD